MSQEADPCAWLVGTTTVVGTVTAGLTARAFRPRTPVDDSAEAGYARAKSAYHEQAIETALATRDRPTDPVGRTMATGMVVTKAHESVGMTGWKDGAIPLLGRTSR